MSEMALAGGGEVSEMMTAVRAGWAEGNETDKGRQDELDAAAKFFAGLAKGGAAAVEVLEGRGSVFYEASIEGVKLTAYVSNGLFLGHKASRSAAEFGKAGLRKFEADWWIVEYGHEKLFRLQGLTDAGAKAVAIHFGLKIDGLGCDASGESEFFGEAEAFYSGTAYGQLVEWARVHPRRAKQGGGSPYLGDWGANAYADARKVPQEA